MHFSTYITVFGNIFKNFSYLKSDFTGISFNLVIFGHFIANIFIAALFILVYFLIGRKIRTLCFKNNSNKKFAIFIDLALGYIVVNSGLAILGLFSLLYPVILWIYIGFILLVAFYPSHRSNYLKNEVMEFFNCVKKQIRDKKWIFLGTCLFVLIAFLRLIPPEIGEDALSYHTGDSRAFLKSHTTIIASKMPPYVMPAPHLGEMSYVLSEFVGLRDSTRYIHFSFYILVVFFLILINPYAALFFVTAPVVIQISSKANVDFQWILCWLLSIFLIAKNDSRKTASMVLIGVLAGGFLASKLWMIAFLPLFILYLFIHYRKSNLSHRFFMSFIFLSSAFLVDFVWLWRSFIISGNPLYPVLSTVTTLDGVSGALGVGHIVGFNNLMFNIKNIGVFSPLLFLGVLILFFHWRHTLKLLNRYNLSLFFIFLTAEYLFIRYHFGRYLLGLYSLAVLVVAMGVSKLINKFNLYKIIFIAIFGIMFIYYFINTLLMLPYGLGWADNNKYLTRIIIRDNTNYYNFDHAFDKLISNKDKVATYGIYGYYYANFDYVDINYIFDVNNRSFDLLSDRNVTKLLIRGGDIVWFCKTIALRDCSLNKVKLVASYPKVMSKFYLYSLVQSIRLR